MKGRNFEHLDQTKRATSVSLRALVQLHGFDRMCFYNQKRFACGDWSWTSFAHRCNYEYRTGETCGMRLVNMTEFETTLCRLCEKIETKYRRRSAEMERLKRWEREGSNLVASMDRSQKIIMELEKEIRQLQRERDDRRKALS
ncbi:hypothetical protein AbraIFM66951_002198 [Aspergillus brasiliensis]|nr:hypothetical protein AbraIFM66951_002198 [Aspergillus brasiliensis]